MDWTFFWFEFAHNLVVGFTAISLYRVLMWWVGRSR
ncbi:Uncharacterised protein [Mycobacteroides abscessus subsp. abscessus]|nr:Uncharacterised protein [Mycobacteroides abscessus subsp. abscessus]SIA07893.1 Uncharacterised protein [Mycobacteroides abscessus subsp. abscessus]SIA65679.1 Uncharacterised protein [Mycobacteroides abscessus subsp. abscessus]SIA70876.1 Uncharacterised protein [Mycobacteroides abscessus subsp. abscessus]SIA73051.1 Uncharacterised protein [Mycobacteroides abscessus subsp. abscessus]